MTLALVALVLSMPLGAMGQTPAAPPPQVAPLPVCPSPPPRFAAIVLDPSADIHVGATQQFIVALRAVEDAGSSWRLAGIVEKPSPVRLEGMQSMRDVAFQNLERKPGDAPIVGGSATEMFLFTTTGLGTATMTFGLFGPGADSPSRTVTFTARVSPSVRIC
jgi:hypothetical protein